MTRPPCGNSRPRWKSINGRAGVSSRRGPKSSRSSRRSDIANQTKPLSCGVANAARASSATGGTPDSLRIDDPPQFDAVWEGVEAWRIGVIWVNRSRDQRIPGPYPRRPIVVAGLDMPTFGVPGCGDTGVSLLSIPTRTSAVTPLRSSPWKANLREKPLSERAAFAMLRSEVLEDNLHHPPSSKSSENDTKRLSRAQHHPHSVLTRRPWAAKPDLAYTEPIAFMVSPFTPRNSILEKLRILAN